MYTSLSERETKLLLLLVETENHSLKDFSRELGVTTVTIRNDLESLANKHYIVRTKGATFPAFHHYVLERQEQQAEEKTRIAKAAAEMVVDNDTIMINAGTTTATLGKYLFGKRNLRVVTDSALLLLYARTNPQVKLTVVGGEFDPSTESFMGPAAVTELKKYRVRTAFVGTAGFSADFGVTTDETGSAEIVRTMADQSDQIVVMADSSKLNRGGFAHMLPIERVSVLITDDNIDKQAIEAFAEKGVAIRVV